MSILSNKKAFEEILTSTAENLANDLVASAKKIETVHQKLDKEYGESLVLLDDKEISINESESF